MLSLEFPSAEQAKVFRKALEPVWEASGAGQAWMLEQAAAATDRMMAGSIGGSRFEFPPKPPGRRARHSGQREMSLHGTSV